MVRTSASDITAEFTLDQSILLEKTGNPKVSA